jgi:hypothetical protein
MGVMLAAGVVGGIILFPGSAPAGPGHTGSPDADRVLICESGVVSRDGIDTSSSIVVRVLEGTPVPPGCRDG